MANNLIYNNNVCTFIYIFLEYAELLPIFIMQISMNPFFRKHNLRHQTFLECPLCETSQLKSTKKTLTNNIFIKM